MYLTVLQTASEEDPGNILPVTVSEALAHKSTAQLLYILGPFVLLLLLALLLFVPVFVFAFLVCHPYRQLHSSCS